MGTHPTFSATGPSLGYQPKTSDEADSTTAGTVVPHLNAQQFGSWTATLSDGLIASNKATVAQFHNADNQNPGSTGYGLLTGGVAQLLNVAGNIDRQREAGIDGSPAVGIAAGATSLSMSFKTSISAAITASTTAQAVTPAAMTGTIGGVAWSIQVGSVLAIDTGASREFVVVSAVTSTTFSAIFSKSHSASVVVSGFVFNQARDAAGESDGATGIGTAVAAEYEYNGGAPGGGNFDRARSVQAKGRTTTSISAGGATGSSSLTVSAAGTLKAGAQVLLYKASTYPAAGSYEAAYVDLSYVEGSTTVPLASATVGATTYDTLAYDSFSALGPTLGGFNAVGVGIEEEAIYDPVSGLFYLERAATQDAMAPQNIVAEANALWNGSSMDRQRGNVDAGALITLSAAASGSSSGDQTNYNGRGATIVVNVTAISGTSPTLTVTVQGKDSASGAYYTILTSASITATGATVLQVYPGLTAAANTVANLPLPRTWRVTTAIGGTSPSVTATVGASVIV